MTVASMHLLIVNFNIWSERNKINIQAWPSPSRSYHPCQYSPAVSSSELHTENWLTTTGLWNTINMRSHSPPDAVLQKVYHLLHQVLPDHLEDLVLLEHLPQNIDRQVPSGTAPSTSHASISCCEKRVAAILSPHYSSVKITAIKTNCPPEKQQSQAHAQASVGQCELQPLIHSMRQSWPHSWSASGPKRSPRLPGMLMMQGRNDDEHDCRNVVNHSGARR